MNNIELSVELPKWSDYLTSEFLCPNCGEEINFSLDHEDCSSCGVKLNWGNLKTKQDKFLDVSFILLESGPDLRINKDAINLEALINYPILQDNKPVGFITQACWEDDKLKVGGKLFKRYLGSLENK